MADYAVMVKHPGFANRFLKAEVPPQSIGMTYWATMYEKEIMRFKRRQSAENCKAAYELHFASAGENGYSFVVMKLVLVPKWVEDCPECDGTGVMKGDSTAPFGSIRRQDVPCPHCRKMA